MKKFTIFGGLALIPILFVVVLSALMLMVMMFSSSDSEGNYGGGEWVAESYFLWVNLRSQRSIFQSIRRQQKNMEFLRTSWGRDCPYAQLDRSDVRQTSSDSVD